MNVGILIPDSLKMIRDSTLSSLIMTFQLRQMIKLDVTYLNSPYHKCPLSNLKTSWKFNKQITSQTQWFAMS